MGGYGMSKEDPRQYEKYTKSDAEREKLHKRTLTVVIMSQIFGGAGLAAGITVGALIAQDMLETTRYAGLPAALFTLGSALSAFVVGRLSQRLGRRLGLTIGFVTGGIGAIGVIFATTFNIIWLFFLALFIYGAGTSTNLQARYAGADLANARQRATAVSIAMVSTTFGAVAGPNLVEPMGKVAEFINIPSLAGPFILAAVAYILAGLTFFFYLRPDPLFVAQAIAEEESRQADAAGIPVDRGHTSIQRIGIIVGSIVLVLSQMVMSSIMTMTPVHMRDHGSGLSAVGLVIGLHIAAMYLPSIVTGRLVDRIGRHRIVIASGITLGISGIMAAYAPGESLFWMAFALILLGLGWNFGLISGTAIIVDSTNVYTRAKTQGSVDVFIALGGSAGSLLSGIIVANASFSILGFIGMYLALLLIPLIFWVRLKEKKLAQDKMRMTS